ncbi:MAG: hypothetical protein LBS88_09030 [Tannerellaceae bacterium]|jgi:hypothetical protein|nr:hypothetical protein [Tannerellaceae bacterium]
MVRINTFFLRFRFRQAGKFLREIPLLYLLALLVLSAVAGSALYAFMERRAGAWAVAAGLLLLLSLLHLRRKDYHFVCLAEAAAWQVFGLDYLLLSLPVLILEAVQGHGFMVPIIVLGCMGIGWIKQPYYQTARGFPVPRFIPAEAFEVRTGFRRLGGWLLVFYLGAFVGLLLPYVSFVLLWFFMLFWTEFFRDCEPELMLCSRELPARRFIYTKLAVNLRLFAIAAAPVCLLYTALRPGDWWLACGFFVLSVLNIALLVLMKYALYRPHHKLVSGQVGLFLSMAGVVIPFLSPLTLLLLVRYAILSRRNLTSYLYVYD